MTNRLSDRDAPPRHIVPACPSATPAIDVSGTNSSALRESTLATSKRISPAPTGAPISCLRSFEIDPPVDRGHQIGLFDVLLDHSDLGGHFVALRRGDVCVDGSPIAHRGRHLSLVTELFRLEGRHFSRSSAVSRVPRIVFPPFGPVPRLHLHTLGKRYRRVRQSPADAAPSRSNWC